MSNYKTHSFVGLFAGIGALAIIGFIFTKVPYFQNHVPELKKPFPIVIIPFIVAPIYALMPDIDIKSMGSRIFYFAVSLIIVVFLSREMYEAGCLTALISILPQLLKHRGITHTIWFAFFFPVPVYFLFLLFNIPNIYFLVFYISAVFGMLSHLIVDKVT